jgi:uncharacterized protein with PQ loop repeat
MTQIIRILGFAGIAISCIAYVPQIVHLAKEHCSAGISIKAWLLWLLATLLMFLHAYSIVFCFYHAASCECSGDNYDYCLVHAVPEYVLR